MDEEHEEWRLVSAAYGPYEVSNLGRVRSVDREDSRGRLHRGKVIRIHRERYSSVVLRVGGRSRRIYVHRLVLETFVGPRPDGMVARHLNGMSHDNRLANLARGTQLENCADKRRHGTQTRGSTHPTSKLSIDDVLEIRASTEKVQVLSERYGISTGHVSDIRNGKRWSHVRGH